MSPSLARHTIEALRGLPPAEADKALCAMHSDAWHAIASVLGLRLPLRGGDKPCILVGALFPPGRKALDL